MSSGDCASDAHSRERGNSAGQTELVMYVAKQDGASRRFS